MIDRLLYDGASSFVPTMSFFFYVTHTEATIRDESIEPYDDLEVADNGGRIPKQTQTRRWFNNNNKKVALFLLCQRDRNRCGLRRYDSAWVRASDLYRTCLSTSNRNMITD